MDEFSLVDTIVMEDNLILNREVLKLTNIKGFGNDICKDCLMDVIEQTEEFKIMYYHQWRAIRAY